MVFFELSDRNVVFMRTEALTAMRRVESKYKSGSVSAYLFYRCCANVLRYYKLMYDDYEKLGNGLYVIKTMD